MIRVYNRLKLVDLLAEELAYRQNLADYWYYIENNQEMSSYTLDTLVALNDFAIGSRLVDDVYEKALELYDFSNSGRLNHAPDFDYILDKHHNFQRSRNSLSYF